jgi:hypothetical protein
VDEGLVGGFGLVVVVGSFDEFAGRGDPDEAASDLISTCGV